MLAQRALGPPEMAKAAADQILKASRLGPSSVRETIEGQGGLITVASELGKGTRFAASVLYVEDTDLVRNVVVRLLNGAGFQTVPAPNVDDALAALRLAQSPFDILLTDCVLPGRPVADLIEEFRNASPSGHVVMCSGYGPDEVSPSGNIYDAFLTKPFSAQLLVSTINRMLTS